MKTLPRPTALMLISLALLPLCLPSFASPVSLVYQDFDSVPSQSHANGAGTTIGTGTGSLSLTTATGTTLAITGAGPGNNALRYTDNQNGGSSPNVSTPAFTGVSTTATGNHYIVGSFDFKALPVPSGSAPAFIFMINANSQVNTGAHSSVIISFANSAGSATSVSYNDGGTTVANVTTLTANTSYRLSLVADYGNTGSSNHDSYSFTITNLDAGGVVYRSPFIATRSTADLTPNRFAFYGGAGNAVFNASPFFEIDNLRFDSTDTVFHWGVSGHPTFTSSPAYYSVVPLSGASSTSPVGQAELVRELGCDYYRVDVSDQPKLDALVPIMNAHGIRLLPVLGIAYGFDATQPNYLFNPALTTGEIYNACKAKAAAFVQRYPDTFTHIELANELDNKCLNDGLAGASPADYDTFKYTRIMHALRGLADGVHENDPSIQRLINTAGWYHYGFLDKLVADGVPFEVIGWHWYSSMGSISRVMQKLSGYGKPVWITECNRFGGSYQTSLVMGDDFTADALATAPANWSSSGTWRVRQYGGVKAVVNEDTGASSGRSITRVLSSPVTGNWEVNFDYDWRWGGNSTHGYGSYGLIIDCDVTDHAGNGYRLRVRQGNGNNPANDNSVLGLYKLTAGIDTLIPGAQGPGYNQSGFANGSPRLKHLRFRRDKTNNKLSVESDPDGDGILTTLSGVDATHDAFTRVVFTARGYGNGEQPLIDNITLADVRTDEALQETGLATLVSELRSFPAIQAVFAYELLDEPNLGTFNPEAYYGLCSLTFNGSGDRVFNARKPAFAAYQDAILTYGPLPASPAQGIIIDDSYPAPAVKYAASSSFWPEASTLPGYYFAGYRHDANTNKTAANYTRFYASIPVAGNYEISIRYPAHSGNAASVPVKIHHPVNATGSSSTFENVTVNQQTGGDSWQVLGTFYFNAWQPGHPTGLTSWETTANAAYVEINNGGTSGRVVADAVRFRPVP